MVATPETPIYFNDIDYTDNKKFKLALKKYKGKFGADAIKLVKPTNQRGGSRKFSKKRISKSRKSNSKRKYRKSRKSKRLIRKRK